MKIRNGFVSNSSSSSFIIDKKNLCSCQIEKIKNHMDEYIKLHPNCYKNYYHRNKTDEENLRMFQNNKWSITEDYEYIKGWTLMDNFPMNEFLKNIGVKEEDVKWSD